MENRKQRLKEFGSIEKDHKMRQEAISGLKNIGDL